MIYGIGIDVIEPARVARVLERFGERFVRRVLTPRERPGYARTAQPVLFLANRFSAKEAFSKAMGTGFRYPVNLQSMVEARGIVGHHLTISDERSLACACVVLEK
jgi:holo-[acyl-carrier protein] synthase